MCSEKEDKIISFSGVKNFLVKEITGLLITAKSLLSENSLQKKDFLKKIVVSCEHFLGKLENGGFSEENLEVSIKFFKDSLKDEERLEICSEIRFFLRKLENWSEIFYKKLAKKKEKRSEGKCIYKKLVTEKLKVES
jgi:hypothetical protein